MVLRRKRILLTNDDGIYGPGLAPLRKALSKFGDIFVIVPDQERSADSHSLTLHKPLRFKQVAPQTYILSGTPADCVRFGVLHLLHHKVDLVVAGVNSGVNLGEDVIYSGTVAAAMEAAILRIPGLAVSRPPGIDPVGFASAAQIASRLVQAVLRYGLPRGVCLNLNVPSLKTNVSSEFKDFRITHLGHRLYAKKVGIRRDPRGRLYYWLLAKNVRGVPTPASDVEAFERGYATITPLALDCTATGYLSELREWKI